MTIPMPTTRVPKIAQKKAGDLRSFQPADDFLSFRIEQPASPVAEKPAARTVIPVVGFESFRFPG